MTSTSTSFTYHSTPYPAIDPTNPSLSAQDKVVVVTGGGSGIGKSIATAFATADARAIIILGRTASTLESAAKEIASAASNKQIIIRLFAADIRDSESIIKVFKAVKQDIGPVDVLINNAGYLSDLDTIENSDLEDVWTMFEVNVKGTLNIVQTFLRHGLDKDSKLKPTIINLATAGIHLPYYPTLGSYAASKLAAWKIIEFVSYETQDTAYVYSIHPGTIDSGMTKKAKVNGVDDIALPGAFCVWLAATPEADFLRGRMIWSNWDVQEMLEHKDEIVNQDLFRLKLSGWSM